MTQSAGGARQFLWGATQFEGAVTQLEGAVLQFEGGVPQFAGAETREGWALAAEPGAVPWAGNLAPKGPPSPRSGEGPRVRIRRAGRTNR